MSVDVRVDLRGQFGVSRDQRRRPTCLAFAASDCHAAARGVPFRELSTEYAFYHAHKRKGGTFDPTAGIPLKFMLSAIRDDGQPLEAVWPYMPTLPKDLNEYRPPSNIGDIYRRSSSLCPGNIDAICQALNHGKPLVIILRPTIQFHLAKRGETIRAPHNEPPSAMAHAVVGVGWGQDHSERVILIRNSWGARWADDGHAWVAETFLQPRLRDVVIME